MKTFILCAAVCTLTGVISAASADVVLASAFDLKEMILPCSASDFAGGNPSNAKVVLLAEEDREAGIEVVSAADGTVYRAEGEFYEDSVKLLVCKIRVIKDARGNVVGAQPIAVEGIYDIKDASKMIDIGSTYAIPVEDLDFKGAAKLSALGVYAGFRVLGATVLNTANVVGPRIVAAAPLVRDILISAIGHVWGGVKSVAGRVVGGGRRS